MIRVEVKEANWFMERILDLFGADGWTSFWNTIYIRKSHIMDQKLIKHEMKHAKQIQSEGRFNFTINYIKYHFKYGYKNNPYEVEARKAEDE